MLYIMASFTACCVCSEVLLCIVLFLWVFMQPAFYWIWPARFKSINFWGIVETDILQPDDLSVTYRQYYWLYAYSDAVGGVVTDSISHWRFLGHIFNAYRKEIWGNVE